MATVTITIDDKVDGAIGVLCESHNPDNEESGAEMVAIIVMDMLQSMLEELREDAKLPEVPGEDGRL